jgi:polyvinyl alcohol dehydrogenase (cytochrome)
VNGRDLLVLPQKSGIAWAIDPDKNGEVVWQRRIGQGSGLGGQWGGAVDGQQAYFGVSDLLSPNPGGMRAVNLATGEMAWSVDPQKPLCGEGRTCRASQGAAVTAIPGAVFSGSLDGGMRAYSARRRARGSRRHRVGRHALLQFGLRRVHRQPGQCAAGLCDRLGQREAVGR